MENIGFCGGDSQILTDMGSLEVRRGLRFSGQLIFCQSCESEVDGSEFAFSQAPPEAGTRFVPSVRACVRLEGLQKVCPPASLLPILAIGFSLSLSPSPLPNPPIQLQLALSVVFRLVAHRAA